MASRNSKLELLSRNLHLLSPGKQQVARWLCEDWAKTSQAAPRWLQRALKSTDDVALGSLQRPDALLRELVLELLSLHRDEILRRRRVDAERGVLLGPRPIEAPGNPKGPP